MLETPTRGALQSQYECARALRSQAFRDSLGWLVRVLHRKKGPHQVVRPVDCSACV